MRQELPELVREAVLQKEPPKGGVIPVSLYFILRSNEAFYTKRSQKLQKLG